jgi:uncharacterized transporter YbjL
VSKWFVETLRAHPEIAVYPLGIGYWVGDKSWKGLSLGAATSMLIAAVIVGQLGIGISANVKTTLLLMLLVAVGYGVGPQFVRGINLFLWGAFTTTLPLVAGMLVARYVFRFDPAILLGGGAGGRTITAALGAIREVTKSRVPGLGYTVTYAVGNTLLTMGGMVIVMLLA